MLKRAGEPGYSLVELLVTLAIVGLVASAVAGVYQVSQQTYIRASSLEAAQVGARAGLDRMANELRLIGSYWVGVSSCAPLPNCNAITAAIPTSITFMANVDDRSVINGAEATATSFPAADSIVLSLTATDTDDAFKVYLNNSNLNDWIYIADGGTRDVKQVSTRSDSTLTLNMNTGNPSVSNLGSIYPVGSLVRDVKTITYARNANATSTCPALTCLTRTQGGANAETIVDNVTGLTFTYYGTNGCTDPGCTGCTGTGGTGGGALGASPNPALIREIRIELTVQGPDRSTRCMTTRVRPRSLPW